MATVGKGELIELVREKTGKTKKDVQLIINETFKTIQDVLLKGDTINIKGFGALKVSGRKERIGRNPATGEKITIPAYKTVVFKISDLFRETLNK